MSSSCWKIIEWSAWSGFLIRSALPDAEVVTVHPGFDEDFSRFIGSPLLRHINLTIPSLAFPFLDKLREEAEGWGTPICNGYCETIDKYSIQNACDASNLPIARAEKEGDDNELVVVKTRANHGGKHDKMLPAAIIGSLAPPDWFGGDRIRVMRRAELVSETWDHPGLVVERCIDNPQGIFHRAYVAGRYVAAATAQSGSFLKEMDHRAGVDFRSSFSGDSLPVDNFDPLSIAFRLARAMKADFAAIDIAVDAEGLGYAIDLNSTPWWGDDANPRLLDELREAFARLAITGSLYAVVG